MKRIIKKTKQAAGGLCFLCPSLLGVGAFFILPFFVIGYYSLVTGIGVREFVGLQNYVQLFENTAFRLAARNTLTFSLTAVPLAVLLALLLALALEARIPWSSRFRTAFLSPLMVPVASVVLIWQVLFSYNGAVNEFLLLFGAERIYWLNSDCCQLVIAVLFLWKNLGYNMILFMAALSNIPREPLEAAGLDGATETRKFFSIKLRYLSPTILFVAVLSLMNSFKIFREVYLLTGNYPYEGLYTLQHFMNNTFRSLDYQKLSAAAVVMAAVMAAVIAVLFLLEERFGKDVEE